MQTGAGGICGYNDRGIISGCYNVAPLSGYNVGGIARFSRRGTIENCYQYGSVSGSEYTYPIAGISSTTVTNSYYNSDLFTGDGTVYEGTPLTAVQFAEQSSFTGWDFSGVWMFDGNAPRPVLKNNVEEIGSKTNPYILKNADDLKNFRNRVNGGETYAGKFVALGDNIDISSETNWTPIGNYSNQFKGSFDGQGYEIKGLRVVGNSDYSPYVGLFGFIGEGAAVKNLTVSGTVGGDVRCTGGVVGENDGTMENVVNKVAMDTSGQCAGGIAASNQGKIINCSNEANIKASGATVGGIVGRNTA